MRVFPPPRWPGVRRARHGGGDLRAPARCPRVRELRSRPSAVARSVVSAAEQGGSTPPTTTATARQWRRRSRRRWWPGGAMRGERRSCGQWRTARCRERCQRMRAQTASAPAVVRRVAPAAEGDGIHGADNDVRGAARAPGKFRCRGGRRRGARGTATLRPMQSWPGAAVRTLNYDDKV
jgi:hypothetical protein